VDFIIRKGMEIVPVEVKCAHCADVAIGRSLRSFIEKYKPEKALLVTLSTKAEKKINDTTVAWTPWYELLP
jgi:hypothetical protein